MARTGGSLLDVPGLAVGHAQRVGAGWLTGTTVVLAPPGGVVAAVDVRGGGPATRETDALAPGTLVERVEAVVLTGGSAYGLEAAGGVVRWLEERQRGFRVGPEPHHVVPVVPAAALFDLGRGGDFGARPDAALGYAAAEAASSTAAAEGSVGAGTGAVAGTAATGSPGLVKGGVGTASARLADRPPLEGVDGLVVAALVVVNAAGSAVDVGTGALLGAARGEPGEFPDPPSPAEHAAAAEAAALAAPPAASPPPLNTTIGVVATDAALTRAEAARLASAGQTGLARALHPVHTVFDGDTLFALATGARTVPADLPARPQALAALQAAAADVVARAVAHAVLAAEGAAGLPAYADRYPSARRR